MRLVLLILSVVSSAEAATQYAASLDFVDVSNSVAGAARNDTVVVPAGTVNWTSTLAITKGISLIATGGFTTTIITNSGVAIDIHPDATAIANEETVKLYGFTLDGSNAALNIVTIESAGATATKPFKKLIIGKCRFQNTGTVTSGSGAIANVGQVRGVIYSNVFDRCNVVVKIMGLDDVNEWQNAAFCPFSFGSADNLYFECNTIQFSSAGSWADPGWMQNGQGSRLVVRYNTWDMTNASQGELWDIHGAQNWPGGQDSSMVVEYYGNWATNCTGYRWINHRGGWGLFFNNICSKSMAINANQYVGCISDTGAPSEEITNTYCWNNLGNGTIRNMALGDATNCGLAEDRNFYNYNASFDGTAGIGRGTSAPGGTCTIGVGYWVASTETPSIDPSVIQAGHLWKATAANTWTDYYTPYTFPHPLSADGGTPPANPTRTANAVTVHVGTMTQPAP